MKIDNLLEQLSSPAQRALQNTGITSFDQLSAYTEKEILALHGIGKNALQTIREAMHKKGLSLKP